VSTSTPAARTGRAKVHSGGSAPSVRSDACTAGALRRVDVPNPLESAEVSVGPGPRYPLHLSGPSPVFAVACVLAAFGAFDARPATADEAAPALSVRNDGKRALTKTVAGVRWSLRGARLDVTVTRAASARIRRRILGHTLVVACGREGRILSELANTHTRARFPRSVGRTAVVVLPKHLPRVTACAIEEPGRGDDLVAVRFAPERGSRLGS